MEHLSIKVRLNNINTITIIVIVLTIIIDVVMIIVMIRCKNGEHGKLVADSE